MVATIRRGLLSSLLLGVCLIVQPPIGSADATLDKRSYIHRMEVHGHYFPGTERGGKLQMMVQGKRRYIVQAGEGGTIIDVSDPLNPSVVTENAWSAGDVGQSEIPQIQQIQVAYNKEQDKWLALVAGEKYRLMSPGLRGIEIYDITKPEAPKLLSRWSVDGGAPGRELQMGTGPHGMFYSGGRYAYLSTAPDNSFWAPPDDMEKAGPIGSFLGYSWALQIIDLADPSEPRWVANWHLPGTRVDELGERRAWSNLDITSLTGLHGAIQVPKDVEGGGRYGYAPWSQNGFVILDFTSVERPQKVSQWQPSPAISGPTIPVHSVDVSRIDRGFVIVNSEALIPGCDHDRGRAYILDVTNPAQPLALSVLPEPTPPADAPYESFCERFGRFAAHNPPPLEAPGRVHPSFTCYAYFNAGVQCFDIRDPRKPKIDSYFIPAQRVDVDSSSKRVRAPGARTVDNLLIEWDRKLIWVAADTGLYLVSAQMLGTPVLHPMAADLAIPSDT